MFPTAFATPAYKGPGTRDRKPRLTRKEAELLDLLRRHPGQVLTREYLLQSVWHYETGTRTRTLDVHIQRLRRKLAPEDARRILTIFRTGYCWKGNGEGNEHGAAVE
jgi:DNA-binding response OmpR family regulator